jgi:YidC/Oxa1 family membrane protein insertase
VERQIHFFAGPKEYRTLARIASRFQNNVDLVMGFGGFFGFFAKALLLSMNGLQQVLHLGYGWIIIVITVIIKVLFWPLTQASTRSMKRMAALQPQMKALQEKYKDDPAKMNKKLMEFMKENKVSPLGGCLPMLLQMPVFIGFFYMIRSAIELRGARFLWVNDLSKPDTLFVIPGLNFPFNPLPLIMGVTMLWQARMTPPSPGMDPTQQKIMKYMPLIFLFMLYNFSAGLTLYWTVQNLLTIAQMKLTKMQPDASATPKAPVVIAPPKKRK